MPLNLPITLIIYCSPKVSYNNYYFQLLHAVFLDSYIGYNMYVVLSLTVNI